MAQTVREVMTAGVTAVQPQASLTEVAKLMRDHDIGDVLVASGDDVVGVITDRDITVRVVAEGVDPQGVAAETVCSGPPATVAPEDDTAEAVRLMREHAVRRLPVVSEGRPIGVISLGDLAVARDPDSALADISSTEPDR